jgi:hypothetical protein
VDITDIFKSLSEEMHRWTSAFTGIDTKSSSAPGDGVHFIPHSDMGSDPEGIVQWIEKNIPCPDGPVTKQWEETVWAEAAKQHIRKDFMFKAFDLARKKGYQFSSMSMSVELQTPLPDTLPNTGPQMRSSSQGERRDDRIATARVLETKFEIAVNTGNVPDMQMIARRFVDMLNSSARDLGPLDEEEMQHGAPLLRRSLVISGLPEAQEGGENGPYRLLYKMVPNVEAEFENEMPDPPKAE